VHSSLRTRSGFLTPPIILLRDRSSGVLAKNMGLECNPLCGRPPRTDFEQFSRECKGSRKPLFASRTGDTTFMWPKHVAVIACILCRENIFLSPRQAIWSTVSTAFCDAIAYARGQLVRSAVPLTQQTFQYTFALVPEVMQLSPTLRDQGGPQNGDPTRNLPPNKRRMLRGQSGHGGSPEAWLLCL
jgi:hypothetical protein